MATGEDARRILAIQEERIEVYAKFNEWVLCKKVMALEFQTNRSMFFNGYFLYAGCCISFCATEPTRCTCPHTQTTTLKATRKL